MDVLTTDQIKAQYPNEWVLVGNPKILGSTVIAGTVVLHSKDKREIAYSPVNWRENFKTAITVFTGEIPGNRKFWL